MGNERHTVAGDWVTIWRYSLFYMETYSSSLVRSLSMRTVSVLRTDMTTKNFLIITNPEDFALVTALYRSSIDGRRFMYEAILSEDGEYDIPEKFTSRSAEILQVYLKSLGVRMETIIDDSEFIGEPEHDMETVGYTIRNRIIFCTPNEMYYLRKLSKLYKRYTKDRLNSIDDLDEVWEYIMENLPFKKKCLTDNIINLFNDNLEAFCN